MTQAQILHEQQRFHANHSDHYEELKRAIIATFDSAVKRGPIMRTDASGLFDAFLLALHPDIRQHYTCHACAEFFNSYGGLCVVGVDGTVEPAVLPLVDLESFDDSIMAMRAIVRRSRVIGAFVSSDRILGSEIKGVSKTTGEPWSHFHVQVPEDKVHRSKVLTAFQREAEMNQNYETVMRALDKYSQRVVAAALPLLQSDVAYRSEKVLGQAEFLQSLHNVIATTKNALRRETLLRSAVAAAPDGFCHPSASMIGTLLDDIASGRSAESCLRSFALKMDPLKYQRPQAAPTAGAIAVAEKLVDKLGIRRSFERRYARLDEVKAIWRPREQSAEKPGGMFGHLKTRPTIGGVEFPGLVVPSVTMTWVKFLATVLPTAVRIEVVPRAYDDFVVLTTAVHADAPPILQWDTEEARNPVGYYRYYGGSPASRYGIRASGFVDVDAICESPSHWNGKLSHFGDDIFAILRGARESNRAGGALFPETMRAELREVRSVIEAYSASATIAGMDEPHAVGLALVQKNAHVSVRVTSETGQVSLFKIDRFD